MRSNRHVVRCNKLLVAAAVTVTVLLLSARVVFSHEHDHDTTSDKSHDDDSHGEALAGLMDEKAEIRNPLRDENFVQHKECARFLCELKPVLLTHS